MTRIIDPDIHSVRMRRQRRGRVLCLLGLSAVVVGSSFGDARASGFAIREQSASALGNAFAGASAGAQDISTMFFNPATLTSQEGHQGLTVANGILVSGKFKNASGSTAGGTPITGGTGGSDIYDDAVVPAAYVMWDVSRSFNLDRAVRLGLGINAPFGLETNYGAGWTGRYHALQSELRTINFNPAMAVEIFDGVSLGAGLQIQRADAKLSNAIDFGSIGASIPALAPISQPTQQDGKATVRGNDWAWGYTLGVTVEPWDGTRFGVGYRSAIKQKLRGRARFTPDDTIGPILQAGGRFTSTNVDAKVTLPESVSFGGYHAFNDAWAIMGEAAWTRWSRFDELRIKFSNPAQPDSVTEEDWNDTWFFALGGTWRPTPTWTLRSGVAYDQTPVPNRTRTPRIPDNDRTWLSLGAAYQPFENLTVDVGYTHIFFDDASVHLKASDPGSQFRGDFSGNVETAIDIFAISLNVQF